MYEKCLKEFLINSERIQKCWIQNFERIQKPFLINLFFIIIINNKAILITDDMKKSKYIFP